MGEGGLQCLLIPEAKSVYFKMGGPLLHSAKQLPIKRFGEKMRNRGNRHLRCPTAGFEFAGCTTMLYIYISHRSYIQLQNDRRVVDYSLAMY